MNFSSSNKKVIIFLVGLAVLLAGWFFMKSTSDENDLPEPAISYKELIKGETFEIVRYDTSDKFLEQREKGLKVKIPEDWTVKKYNEEVDMLSPEVKFDEDGNIYTESVREGACGVAIEILESKEVDSQKDTDAEELRKTIEDIKANPQKSDEENEVVEIDGKLAMKKTFRQANGEIVNILLEIPVNNSIFFIDSGIIMSEKCVNTFEEIVSTVEITK